MKDDGRLLAVDITLCFFNARRAVRHETGLVPGLHPNNVAFILLSISPLILAELHFLTALVPSEIILVLVASTILAASVSHTFLNFIPAAFIGAPEGDTALYLLPAHCCLLLEVILNFGLSYPVVGFEVEI